MIYKQVKDVREARERFARSKQGRCKKRLIKMREAIKKGDISK
jgi:hypothetical protein